MSSKFEFGPDMASGRSDYEAALILHGAAANHAHPDRGLQIGLEALRIFRDWPEEYVGELATRVTADVASMRAQVDELGVDF